MRKDIKIIVLALSAAMGLGTYDPIFASDGLISSLYLLCILFIFYSIFKTDVILSLKRYKHVVSLLLGVPLLFFLSGIIYGYTVFNKDVLNLKLVTAIILFWFLSFVFEKDSKLCLQSLLIFSIACSLLAVSANLGLLGDSYEIVNGRALLFGENPNSTSSRMAIASIFLGYICVQNPLKYTQIRFLLLLFIPSLFIVVIESASRGSFIALVLGFIMLLLYSKVSLKVRLTAIALCLIGFVYYVYNLNEEVVILERLNTAVEERGIGSREDIWNNALEIIYDNPLVGVGEAGYFNEIYKKMSLYVDTHNLFLYLLACGGFLAFLLFNIFLFYVGKNVLRNLKNQNPFPFIFFIFTFLITVKTGGVITYLVMWYLFSILYSFDSNKLQTV